MIQDKIADVIGRKGCDKCADGFMHECIACQTDAILTIPLEQVVDGSVYQFELVWECGTCEGVGNYDDAPDGSCAENIINCSHCTDGKTTKRISHYDLADADIAMAYCDLVDAVELDVFEKVVVNKGTLRAVKVREVS